VLPHRCAPRQRRIHQIEQASQRTDFQISARDECELIARGLHKRAVINAGKFSKRVQEKSA
jgi:predicted thioesterase